MDTLTICRGTLDKQIVLTWLFESTPHLVTKRQDPQNYWLSDVTKGQLKTPCAS
ncbi:hypothetical protein BH10CYA1_BH10CYA1_53600 [soil metagenome]